MGLEKLRGVDFLYEFPSNILGQWQQLLWTIVILAMEWRWRWCFNFSIQAWFLTTCKHARAIRLVSDLWLFSAINILTHNNMVCVVGYSGNRVRSIAVDSNCCGVSYGLHLLGSQEWSWFQFLGAYSVHQPYCRCAIWFCPGTIICSCFPTIDLKDSF